MPIQLVTTCGTDLLTDEDIVARVRAGDTPLFEVLMRRNNQRLYRAVRGTLRDETEVEDVMQQTYLAAFAHLHQFTAAAKFATWLLRIGVNESLARLRHRRQHLHPIQDDHDELEGTSSEMKIPTPEDRVANLELAALLESTIDQLPGKYRQVLMLRLVEGLDTAETAAVLQLEEDAVKQRLHRARTMVQKLMDHHLAASTSSAFEFRAPRCDRVVTAVLEQLGDQARDGIMSTTARPPGSAS
jgi:RNA polymerase sigma-70 factor (ECF subfamily)